MNDYKTCPTCGRELPYSAFHKDASRPDGLKWQCKECFQGKRNIKYVERDRAKMKSNSEFNEIYSDPRMHDYIKGLVQRYAHSRPSLQEDWSQEAWLGVAMSTGESFEEWAKSAHNAVEKFYRRDYKDRKAEEELAKEDIDWLM